MRLSKTALVATMLTGGACVNAAVLSTPQNWSVVSAEGSLQGLSVQLIDLDPNDGITPQIVFAEEEMFTAEYGDKSFVQSSIRPAGTSFPLSISDQGMTHPDGRSAASMSASGLYAGAGSSAEMISQNAQFAPGAIYRGFRPVQDWRAGSDAFASNHSKELIATGIGSRNEDAVLVESEYNSWTYQIKPSVSGPGFTVTPNTSVVFSGTISSRVGFDLSQLSIFDPQTTMAQARARVSVEVFSDTPNDGKTTWSGSYLNAVQEIYASFDAQRADVSLELQRLIDPSLVMANGYRPPAGFVGTELTQEIESINPFALTFINNSQQTKGGFFSVNALSSVEITGMMPVPEPATYALMGLGLLGVLCAVSRRKA
jgi:PEP-CTERM motif